MKFGRKKAAETPAEAGEKRNEAAEQDQALFDELNEQKKKKKRRRVRIIVIVVAAVLVLGIVGVITLRSKVRKEFMSTQDEVLSYAATVGSISTTVSGSGSLTWVDAENLTVPANVEIDEVKVTTNEALAAGDVIATVDVATVQSAMAAVQQEIAELDEDITDAADDAVDSYISAGVAGRVKKLYAEKGMSVAQCMNDYGALALLSLDGYMQTEIETDALAAGDSVTVVRAEGKELTGTVSTAGSGKAVVLVTDNGPAMDEEVTVLASDGTELGKGTLSIHNALRITGYAGTVNSLYVRENTAVSAASTILTLTDTATTAAYDTLLRERAEKEEELLELVQLYQTGALTAPYDGKVSAVLYDEDEGTTEDTETELVTFTPAETMSVTISVDETDILSLAVGQTVQITVSSLSSDTTYEGTLTEIDKTASSSSGVTRYSAVVELPYAEGMLPGMTAKAVIRITGVDNAILIPVEALHQTSSTSYVYTEYNEETGEYGGMTEVVAGISNSSYAEITSGLAEGDIVYYTEEEEAFSFGDMGGFGGDMSDMGGFGGDMGGGDMPSMPSGGGGGDMPSMPSGGGGGGMPSGGGRG